MSTDVVDAVIVETPQLVETKLYRLNADEPFLSFLEGDISTKMQVELVLDDEFPRSEEDGDVTRIIVNFTNLNGNGSNFIITDDLRLGRKFDLDAFINGFYAKLNEGIAQDDIAVELIKPTIATAINQGVMVGLEFTEEKYPPRAIATALDSVRSLVSVMLNDPLDAVILLQEQPLQEGQTETDAALVGLWTVKSRD
jgi:hypothetical protein